MTATITAPGQTWEIRRNVFKNPAHQGAVTGGVVTGLNAYQTGSPAGSYGGIVDGWQDLTITSLPAGSRFGLRPNTLILADPVSVVRVQLRNRSSTPTGVTCRAYIDATTATGATVNLGSQVVTGNAIDLTVTSPTPVTQVRLYVWFEPTAGTWTGSYTTGLAWWCVELDPAVGGLPFTGHGVLGGTPADQTTSWAGPATTSDSILTGPATLTIDDVLTARLDRDTGIVEVAGQFVRRASTPTRLAGRVQFLVSSAAAAADLARLYQQFDALRIATDVPGDPLNRLLHRATGRISTQSERTVPGRPARWSVTVDIQEL